MSLSFTKRRLREARPNGPLPGDILLFSHAIGYSKLVPWFTGYRYYHCALYAGGSEVLEARPNGVVRRNIHTEPGNVFRVIPMPEAHGHEALNYAECCLGANYDPLDVLYIMQRQWFPRWPIRYSNHDRFTCGEFVTLAWRRNGLDLFPGLEAAAIVPGDFAQFLPPDARDQMLDPTSAKV